MDKFGRNYILEVQKQDGSILTVQPPFTIEFDITRNTLSSANTASIRVYNLSENNRNQIRFNISDYGTFRSVSLRAGYGTNLPQVFTGNISQAWSVREGTNMITQIECFDGGFAFANGKTQTQFTAGTDQATVIRTIASDMPHLSVGAIGSFPGAIGRGNSYSGGTADLLRELTGGGFFVDLGKVNALGDNEYIDDGSPTLVINSQSGLLGTPVLEQTIVRFEMLFEPTLNVARKIQLQSVTESNYNGFYKVTAVKHRGMISESVCGELVTEGEFFYSKILTGVSPL